MQGELHVYSAPGFVLSLRITEYRTFRARVFIFYFFMGCTNCREMESMHRGSSLSQKVEASWNPFQSLKREVRRGRLEGRVWARRSSNLFFFGFPSGLPQYLIPGLP